MAHCSKTDLERQYEEDLERARALSLESLALEKFRLQKLELEKKKLSSHRPATEIKEERRRASQVENTESSSRSNLEILSRPRPGSFNTGTPRGLSVIAPPPAVIRRNSTATASSSRTSDLISFNSPSPVDKTRSLFEELTVTEQQVIVNIPPLTVNNKPNVINNSVVPYNKPHFGTTFALPADTNRQKPAAITNAPNFDVLKLIGKQDNSNLIDLTPSDSNASLPVRVSVLEAFDPLLLSDGGQADDQESQCSSIYDVYDPFDYMSAPRKDLVEPVYATVEKKKKSPGRSVPDASPPPLPPRSASLTDCQKLNADKKTVKKTKLCEAISPVNKSSTVYDSDIQNFHSMVKSLRAEFPHTDVCTNVGLVISPTIESSYADDTSIKLTVHNKAPPNRPVIFTCDVNSSIEHVILHVVCELEGDLQGSVSDYVLKVYGLEEYLSCSSILADYDYVHQCIKLQQDVTLEILKLTEVNRPLTRTPQDDVNDQALTIEDLLPCEPVTPITYDALVILLETLEREMDKIQVPGDSIKTSQNLKGIVQAVKAVCAHLGNIETLQITEALESLHGACSQSMSSSDNEAHRCVMRPEIVREDGNFSEVQLRRKLDDINPINISLDKVRDAVHALIEAYCQTFHVSFLLHPRYQTSLSVQSLEEMSDFLCVHIESLHRPNLAWQHDDYQVSVQVYHGPRPICIEEFSTTVIPRKSLYQRIVFDCWLGAQLLPLNMLPRESRLVVVLYGRTLLPPENNDTPEQPRIQRAELGWTAIQLFNCHGIFPQGHFLLPLWPTLSDKRLGPAPAAGTHPFGNTDPLIGIELQDYGSKIEFPCDVEDKSLQTLDFLSLDEGTQEQLLVICEQDTFTNPPAEEREILWEKRHYLHGQPEALPKVLLAAHSWDWSSLPDLHSLVHNWTRMEPVSALTLLLPCFPDTEVRRAALTWVRYISCDELVDYLPQLVQALKHETYEASPLAHFLLERALSSPRVAHHLYWLLSQILPGSSPQNSTEDAVNNGLIENRYYRRLQLMLRALLGICGEAMRERFMAQQLLVKGLGEVAENVKGCKESLRVAVLSQGLETVHNALKDTPTCLPLRPSLGVAGIHVRTCSYFHSNTLPLKLNFLSLENEGTLIPAIFKVGDDLQQDMLTIQMIQIMDKLWLKEGLDLKMVTFACVPTGHKRGMIEMVTNAETLRRIHTELGLTGSFKDRPIAEWLAKHNASALEYQLAVDNFTASCAGYCVATYVLGICDRHNDNIMLKTSGHMFHIDFGKFLGDAQMFGNFKRDRTPFVLTSDMAFVINGGDKPSAKFHHFVDLCCQAFNIVRKHRNLLLNLFGLMVSSGIPGVTMDAVKYVQKALLPEHSNVEAAAMFARMIESSLRSWFTQFNFFLHNLAQLQSPSNHNEGELLSFIPSVYTMEREGRIKQVCVHGLQKRYDPEKCYFYIIRVERCGHPDPAYLFRSYREFCELHEKLCFHFPLAKLHSLPTGMHVGRSNIKQVAEKRRIELQRFLCTLFAMADEISHSDLVYTFFHPILRDQQEANIHARKVKDSSRPSLGGSQGRITGQLKLSLQYRRDALLVMVHHARALPSINGQEPSTYVKVYLRPDPAKATKRKTKVVRRNCHPSFMEMLEYRLPLNVVRQRRLEATVWSRDPLQENEFLGGVVLALNDVPLSDEHNAEWYPLGNVQRSHH